MIGLHTSGVLLLGFVLVAAAPLDRAAQERLVSTEHASRDSRHHSIEALAGAIEARRRAAAAAAALPALTARVERSRSHLAVAERKLAAAERAQADRRAAIANRQQDAVQLVAALQTMSRRPPALALVQPGSAADLAHTRMALDAMQPGLQARTASLRAELVAAEPVRRKLQTARDEEASLALTLARDQAALSRAKAVAQRDAATLAARAISDRSAAARYAVDAASLQELVDRLKPSAAAGPHELRLMAPTTGAALLSEADPLLPQSLSFQARPGAAVIAPAAGRIAFAGAFRSYGGVVIVDYGGGWRSILSGFGSVAARTGTIVPAGALLGRVGDAPLRFELRQASRAIDPVPYLPADLVTACRDDASFAHHSRRAKTGASRGEIPCRVRS